MVQPVIGVPLDLAVIFPFRQLIESFTMQEILFHALIIIIITLIMFLEMIHAYCL